MKHLLIDYENLQPHNLDQISTENTHIWLFLGSAHKHLPIELVQSLLSFGDRTHLVRLQKTGKNALDFYLSYYLGKITATDPQAVIGILSRDGGYDILVEHITENRHAQSVIRLADCNKIQIATQPKAPLPSLTGNTAHTQNLPPPAKPLLPLFQAALTALRAPNAFRPSRLHNLYGYLHNHILRDLLSEQDASEKELTVHKVINKLKNQNLIAINEDKLLAYQLDDSDILLKIQKYILHTKPNTLAEFQEKVKERAEILCLNVKNGDIQTFKNYLCKQGLIRQQNDKIEYAPFSKLQTQPENKAQAQNYQPQKAILQKITAAISPQKTNRPNKSESLKNMIKSLANCNADETEQIFQYLKNKKHIQTNQNKIIYLK